MPRFLALAIALAGFLSSALGQQATPTPGVAQVPITPLDAHDGTWTLVVLPDTQYYSKSYPWIFERQTQWIVANRESNNIQFAISVGDIVDTWDDKAQWKVARSALNELVSHKIPFALVPGNHDIGIRNESIRKTMLNDYFAPKDFAANAKMGYFASDRLENTWTEFDTVSGKFLVLALEFGPGDDVLKWANEVVSSHPDRMVIVVTHDYLKPDNTRANAAVDQSANPHSYPLAQSVSVNDGEDMWRKLVSKHPNIRFVLSGHRTGSGYLMSIGSGGQKIHQISSDYQSWPDGGGGYLRLLVFDADGKTLHVRTYSPWYDVWKDKPPEQISFPID